MIASDKEDGDLSEAIKVKENTIKLDNSFKVIEEGEYKVVFEVTDSNGAKIEKEFKVLVENEVKNPSTPNSENDSSKSENSPNTGAVVGGTAIAGIGGVLTLLGAVIFKRKKK